jgi:hypothetical protein
VLGAESGTIQARLTDLRDLVQRRLANLRELLFPDIACARTELAKHVEKIVHCLKVRPIHAITPWLGISVYWDETCNQT